MNGSPPLRALDSVQPVFDTRARRMVVTTITVQAVDTYSVNGTAIAQPVPSNCTHASVALCEACNGISMAMVAQSLYAAVLSCLVRTSMRRFNICTGLALFLYSTVSLRITVVACCNFSSKSVAKSIMWCSTQEREHWAWAAKCQDATRELQLFLGTSIVIQVVLLAGYSWAMYRWRNLCRQCCLRWCGRRNQSHRVRDNVAVAQSTLNSIL